MKTGAYLIGVREVCKILGLLDVSNLYLLQGNFLITYYLDSLWENSIWESACPPLSELATVMVAAI